jgi:hypothetical protein
MRNKTNNERRLKHETRNIKNEAILGVCKILFPIENLPRASSGPASSTIQRKVYLEID